MPNYIKDEQGNTVVELKYSTIPQIKLQQPKGKHIRYIQGKLNELGYSDEMTAVAVAITTLSVEPKMTLEDVDDLDAEDFIEVAEALSSFRFFANSFKRQESKKA